MILHGNATAEISHGNTLSAPNFTDPATDLKLFDFAVANPPFSDKEWMTGFNPANRTNMYVLNTASLQQQKAIMLTFFTSSHPSKAQVREQSSCHMVCCSVVTKRETSVKTSLNTDLSRVSSAYLPIFSTAPASPACIIVIDKEGAAHRTGIFMIDASKSFLKDGNKNRLRAQDIHKIVSVFNKQTEIDAIFPYGAEI